MPVMNRRKRHIRQVVINGELRYRCSRCTVHLPLEAFHQISGKAHSYCKTCRAIINKEKALAPRSGRPEYSSINKETDPLSNEYLDAVARMHAYSRKTPLSFRGCMIAAIDTFIALHGGDSK